jgi:hypothetical protein
MRVKLSNVLELLGGCLVLLAAAAWDWRALLLLVGLVLVVLGYVLDGEPDEASP